MKRDRQRRAADHRQRQPGVEQPAEMQLADSQVRMPSLARISFQA